jgi:gluconate 2-dehydrogenase gamma chain
MISATRRGILIKTILGFGGYAAASALGCKRGESPAAPQPQPRDTARALSEPQLKTLAAACERILPRDQDPGATDLGCADYIDRALGDPDVRAQFGRVMTGGLTALDRQARTRYRKPFHELPAEQQDALLAAWQKSKFGGESGFFEVLHTLTLEGAFGDPSHGGNRDGLGYRLIGFVPPPPSPGGHLVHLPGKKR